MIIKCKIDLKEGKLIINNFNSEYHLKLEQWKKVNKLLESFNLELILY